MFHKLCLLTSIDIHASSTVVFEFKKDKLQAGSFKNVNIFLNN